MTALLLLLALECPATVTGSVEIYLKAFYLHENPPGLRYVYTSETIIATDEEVVITDVEGIPVAYEWWFRPYGSVSKAEAAFELAKTCGEVPDLVFPLIFRDGFETGDTSRWSETFNPPPPTPTPTPTPIPPTPTPTPTPEPPSPLIFEDGFESGDLGAWG